MIAGQHGYCGAAMKSVAWRIIRLNRDLSVLPLNRECGKDERGPGGHIRSKRNIERID